MMTDNDIVERRLRKLGIEKPDGWERWSADARHRWLEHQPARIRNRNKQAKLIVELAARETFVPTPIVIPKDAEITTGVVISCVYGPLSGGYRRSFVLPTKDGESIAVGETGNWGPREFLYRVFRSVAAYAGQCDIYMVHSGLTVHIDSTNFESWVRRSQEDPAGAIIETALLLEERSLGRE